MILRVGYVTRFEALNRSHKRFQTPMQQAFTKYVEEQRIPRGYYYVHPSLPSFVEPEWTQLPSDYKVTEKYWLGYPVIAWFGRRNSTVRLNVEVRVSLPHLERTRLLKCLEAQGIPVRALAYEEGRLYTRIYSAIPASIATAPPDRTTPALRRKMRRFWGNTRSFAYAKKDISVSLGLSCRRSRRRGVSSEPWPR